MEYIVTIFIFEFVKTTDYETFVVFHRITVGCQYDADCRIVLKLQVDLVKCSVNARLKNVNDIGFHTRQDNLCFRITESCIVLQDTRTFFGQHQSEEDNAFELSSFCCHRIDCCLIDIFFAECIHFFRIKRTW